MECETINTCILSPLLQTINYIYIMRSMSGSFVEVSVNNLSFRTSRGEAFVDQRKSVRWSQPKKNVGDLAVRTPVRLECLRLIPSRGP